LENTTDVADRPEFRLKRKKRMVDGKLVDGWFAVDFTLSELKQLRALQRFPFRDPNFNGKFQVATLQEQISLVEQNRQQAEVWIEEKSKSVAWHLKLLNNYFGFPDLPGKTKGSKGKAESTCLYPEMKSTAWHNALEKNGEVPDWKGKRFEDIILGTLERNGYNSSESNLYLQSFETEDLKYVLFQGMYTPSPR